MWHCKTLLKIFEIIGIIKEKNKEFTMEFNEKLQELRKSKGLTQEELAKDLFVSRTAISKWESGRGYPNIDSLKDIAKYFGVTVDDLLSKNQLLAVAEEDKKQLKKHFRDLVFGLLDLCVLLMLFLPLFAIKVEQTIYNISLINLYNVQSYVKMVYYIITIMVVAFGVLTLSMQNYNGVFWIKWKSYISLILGAILLCVFIITLQVYASIVALILLAIKVLILIKR